LAIWGKFTFTFGPGGKNRFESAEIDYCKKKAQSVKSGKKCFLGNLYVLWLIVSGAWRLRVTAHPGPPSLKGAPPHWVFLTFRQFNLQNGIKLKKKLVFFFPKIWVEIVRVDIFQPKKNF